MVTMRSPEMMALAVHLRDEHSQDFAEVLELTDEGLEIRHAILHAE
jgi:hypothetical protein